MVETSEIKIKSSDTEGEIKIVSIEAYKRNIVKVIVSVFLCIISCLTLALAFRFSKKIRLKFMYDRSDIQNATHFWVKNNDNSFTLEEKIVEQNNQIAFVNRHLKYVYKKEENNNNSHFISLQKYFEKESDFQGISKNNILGQQQLYGPCQIQVPIPTFLFFLADTLTKPFFFFQYFSCLVWIAEGFFYFAVIMVVVSFVICCIDFYFMKRSLLQLKQLAETSLKIKTLRPGQQENFIQNVEIDENKIESIPSTELAPGDLVVLGEHSIPCDILLISGELLANESNLTGESIPIPKESLQNYQQIFMEKGKNEEQIDFQVYKDNILFEGTQIIQTKNTQHSQVLGIVLRTGFSSFKGQIFRKMLYPKTTYFGFFITGIKMALILVALATISYLCMVPMMIDKDVPTLLAILRFADSLTWLLPPALPIFYSICQTFAVYRLRNRDIISINSEKVVVAGGLEIMCFDKTGTLTINGMEVYGYTPVTPNEEIQVQEINQMVDQYSIKNAKQNPISFKLFSSCHGVYKIKGQELMGDELDLQMLKFSGFQIENSTDPNIKFTTTNKDLQENLEVYKTFQFLSELQRMSCVAKCNVTKDVFCFVKGSPEKIKELCIQQRLPQDFDLEMQKLAVKGLRIIAMGYKKINEDQVANITRDQVESDLIFLGFFILQNKLKPDTKDVITRLKAANMECKIISGDNPLTTVQTGKSCNIIPINHQVYLLDYDLEQNQFKLQLFDSEGSLDHTQNMIDQDHSERQLSKPNDNKKLPAMAMVNGNSKIGVTDIEVTGGNQGIIGQVKDIIQNDHVDFAISGTAYKYLEENDFELLQNICVKARVFARMKPFQKDKIVENIQKKKFTVGMIGDGINDSAAIKQAHVGISFAMADSSFSASFTTKSESIECIEKILKEGRGTLANLSETYYYLIITSTMKYVDVQIMVQEVSNFTEFQWVFLNYLNAIPLLFLLSWSCPQKTLTNIIPQINFLSLQTVLTIFGYVTIFTIEVIIIYSHLKAQDWHIENSDFTEDDLWFDQAQISTVLFLPSNLFLAASLAALYTSRPFKQYLFQNYALTLVMILVLVYTICLFITEGAAMSILDMHSDYYDNSSFGVNILIISFAFTILLFIFQELVINKLFMKKNIIERDSHLKQLTKQPVSFN